MVTNFRHESFDHFVHFMYYMHGALILFLSPLTVCECGLECVCAAGIFKLTVSSANFTQLVQQKQQEQQKQQQQPSSTQHRK